MSLWILFASIEKKALQSQKNREILAEIYRVSRPELSIDPKEFSLYSHSLNEGASLEGIHNAIFLKPNSNEQAAPDQAFFFAEDFLKLIKSKKKLSPKSSCFSLKKSILSELSHSEISHWYANVVIDLNLKKVDFGLKLRHNPDLNFHQNFAKKSTHDILFWEIANRIHRIINSYCEKNPLKNK